MLKLEPQLRAVVVVLSALGAPLSAHAHGPAVGWVQEALEAGRQGNPAPYALDMNTAG